MKENSLRDHCNFRSQIAPCNCFPVGPAPSQLFKAGFNLGEFGRANRYDRVL